MPLFKYSINLRTAAHSFSHEKPLKSGKAEKKQHEAEVNNSMLFGTSLNRFD
ncbi:hypothetical protein SD77_4433 [Bacillus badius]|uniref:Uncharacterized protein n=1 Tax=Bacillus badius TaxID=1455 RepID=A0ABR5AX06_BACBA|nr:hypothetical protein SD77_4433 [Bacillus badius]